MKWHKSELCIVIAVMCSGCLFLDPSAREDETLFKTQRMIIKPFTVEVAARSGPGFEVTMKPDEASKINAPFSIEFKEMLTKQLVEERAKGNNYCPSGYVIDRIIYSRHWYAEIWVNCKN
ncbi:MAG: hypothetical protein WDM70_07530 [Nitrosomonadales bacterium]